jgi:uncharacterized protein (DUF2147 family)
MYPCGEAVCGKLLYSPEARLEDGSLRANALNPDEPMCGSQMVFNLKRDGAQDWRGGTIHDVENGRKASVKVQLKELNHAEARFYKGISVLGVTEQLTRATAPPPPC